MAKKRKLDNLSPDATASELEQAIKEHQEEQAEVASPEVVEAVETEVVESEQEKIPEAAVSEPKTEEVKEVTESYDYKQGYENLRAWQTKMAQDLGEIKKALSQTAERPQQSVQPANPTITQEQFNEWYSQDPVSASRWMAALEAEQKVQPIDQRIRGVETTLNNILAASTITKFKSQYSDFGEMTEDIQTELNRYPAHLQDNPQYYDTLLDSAYWAAKGRRMRELESKAKEEGRKEVLQKQQAKKSAYVEGAGKPQAESQLDLSKMKSSEIYDYMMAKGLVQQ